MIVEVLYAVSGVSFGIALWLIVARARDTAQRKAYALHVARQKSRATLEAGIISDRV